MLASPLNRFTQFCLRFTLVALGWLLLTSRAAQAQHSSYFCYQDPRTGFTYLQGAIYGRGYHSGGFSYGSPQGSYSAMPGYGGGRYWNGVSYTAPQVSVWRPRRRYVSSPSVVQYPTYDPMVTSPVGGVVASPSNRISPRPIGAPTPTAGIQVP